ncbi:hydantoinase/oxoprolinase family protein [Paracraurococcus lichenis]|uniref:Hydantoinase/oxoprolinase family protein n=1 Tax=Paracraurococcus lichenis TaxID=3064888 RepID=A0ABT9EAB5_9PROT|nr:hydantoinase/oxoprolinase family protein [Paracraurococcus sp. LOR1-02]MDO9713000.1 hydantoinase/oxoprolinase family protein [Paracraurococcus sp. LOR1-02]
MSFRVGVDIGGTFIDFCLWDEAAAELHSLKVLTTPATPGAELLRGLELLEERHGVRPEAITSFVHGTTVGINTVIQRKGARLAMLTTAGFEDVVELARLRMPEAYSLFSRRGAPLVSRDCVFGVGGRVLADGSVEAPLDAEGVRRAARAAQARGVDGIVIALLNAYRNPEQEEAAAALVAEAAPGLFVFRSTEVWPVIREYERTTTALINGYVHPKVRDYLDNLIGGLRARGVPAEPLVTKSNGGVMSAAQGRRDCVSMVLSGTASGVIGAAYLARQAGLDRVITLDIGGTSADVALVIDGEPQFGLGEKIGDLPLYIPSVSVTSIGEGGGSIAWVDEFGVLKVGPESAGSDPGPACYGRGGTRPTITDAFAACGFLGQHELAYGALRPDAALARAAIDTVARPMGLSTEAAAEAIIRIAVSSMYVEVNKLVARSGVDPRDFTLLTFGGAGPMLGCFLARELEMRRVMVPARPGVVSALGGLVADLRNDFIRTLFCTLSGAEAVRLAEAAAALERQGLAWLREEQRFDGPARASWFADMRYHGQSFEIEVALPADALRDGDVGALAEAFHRAHEARYDFCDRQAPVQLVNLRLVMAGSPSRPAMQPLRAGIGDAVAERNLRVFFDGGWHEVPLYRRAALAPGQRLAGPCVVAQDDTTSCIPPGFHAHVDAMGNLILDLMAE